MELNAYSDVRFKKLGILMFFVPLYMTYEDDISLYTSLKYSTVQ